MWKYFRFFGFVLATEVFFSYSLFINENKIRSERRRDESQHKHKPIIFVITFYYFFFCLLAETVCRPCTFLSSRQRENKSMKIVALRTTSSSDSFYLFFFSIVRCRTSGCFHIFAKKVEILHSFRHPSHQKRFD